MAVPTPQVDILSEPRIVDSEHGGGSRSAEFVAEGAASVAEFVGERRVANIGKGLAAELDQTTNDWWEANRQATEAPNIADVFDVDPSEVADAPAPVQALMQEIAKQRLATEQGAISASELKVRHEATLRKYLNQYPQLTEQIMAASGQTLGYNPLGAHIDAMVEQLGTDSSGNSDEWAALDRYADAVGVNMTLKTVAPVQYYTQVMAFAQRDTEYEYMQRELNITKIDKEMRNITELDTFKRTAGSNILGRASGLMNKVSRMVTAAGFDKATFATEILPSLRAEINNFNIGTRAKLLQDFPELTQEQVDSFMQPIEQNLALAMQSASPEEMASAMRLFQVQSEAQIYAQFPEVSNLKIVADLLKDLPQIPGLLEQKKLTGAYTNMIYNLVGADSVYGGGVALDPKSMSQQQREDTYSALADGLSGQLPRAKSDPKNYSVLKNGALQMFDFLKQERAMGTGGSVKGNEKFLALWSDPESANIFSKGGATPAEMARVSEGVTLALEMVRHDARKDVQFFNNLRDNQVKVRAGLGSATLRDRNRQPVTIETLLDMIPPTKEGQVKFVVNWDNAGIDPARVPPETRRQVERDVAALELRFGARITQTIKVMAHMQGSTDYASVAKLYSDQLKAPIISAILLPGG